MITKQKNGLGEPRYNEQNEGIMGCDGVSAYVCTCVCVSRHKTLLALVIIITTLLSSPIGGASRSYFKNFCPHSHPRPRPCVIWFFRTITLESLNQSEPNFHT